MHELMMDCLCMLAIVLGTTAVVLIIGLIDHSGGHDEQ